jgi:cytochrome P450
MRSSRFSRRGTTPRQHVAQLEYLDACIRETLRVRNIIPFVVRVLKADYAVGGVTYPARSVLCPAIHLLHWRPELYPEPRAYRPERFLARKYASHEWDPFGGGNRACLGQTFAMYEMKVVLATLFNELDMRRAPGAVSRPVRRRRWRRMPRAFPRSLPDTHACPSRSPACVAHLATRFQDKSLARTPRASVHLERRRRA